MNKVKIKAVIFDMDGVLIEAKDWHYEALNRALALFGYNISRQDHLTTFDGLPTRRKLQLFSEKCGLPTGLHSFINKMKQVYTMECIFMHCKPVFYHQFALARLKAEGYKLALASNSIRMTVDMMLEKAKLAEYMDLTLSNKDVKKCKPDPEIYHIAIARLGFVPQECLIVEDNFNGIAAARASGAHLLKVDSVDDVTYQNIRARINELENGGKRAAA